MNDYRPNQRDAPTRTPALTERPYASQPRTVLAHEPTPELVTVDCNDAAVTDVPPSGEDHLDLVSNTTPTSDDVWSRIPATVTACGTGDGHRVAEGWSRAQASRGAAPVRLAARQILQALNDDEELDQVLAALYDAGSFNRGAVDLHLAQLLAAPGVAGTPTVPEAARQADPGYRDAFETAVREHAAEWARRTLLPQAGGRHLAELHPDQARIGRIGVFSGEWMWTHPNNGPDYLRIGFVGTLIDRWNGWAVFTCTRPVAEAIVADQQQQRARQQQVLKACGATPEQARRQVDTSMADLYFDGGVIVADQRIMADDPEAIERTGPDADGRYVVMGRNWCWEAVEPYRCDHIVGDLPAFGEEE